MLYLVINSWLHDCCMKYSRFYTYRKKMKCKRKVFSWVHKEMIFLFSIQNKASWGQNWKENVAITSLWGCRWWYLLDEAFNWELHVHLSLASALSVIFNRCWYVLTANIFQHMITFSCSFELNQAADRLSETQVCSTKNLHILIFVTLKHVTGWRLACDGNSLKPTVLSSDFLQCIYFWWPAYE